MNELSEKFAATCPVCGETTKGIYLDEEDSTLDSSVLGSSRQHLSPGRILRCPACRFGFRQSRSSPQELRELYRRMDPTVYDSEVRGRRRTAATHFRILSRYARSGRLLDVGCASGLFLAEALRNGWKVTGIEPNEILYAEARASLHEDAEVLCTTLETADLQGQFDVITLWDVLEHVPEPGNFLQLCYRLLHPSGYLMLNVPNLDSWEARILDRRWPLLLAEHLNYFNRESLALCAKNAGLEPVHFDRRRAWFSLRYVGYRVAQHQIPGSKLIKAMADGAFGRVLVPVSLGEILGVFRRPAQSNKA